MDELVLSDQNSPRERIQGVDRAIEESDRPGFRVGSGSKAMRIDDKTSANLGAAGLNRAQATDAAAQSGASKAARKGGEASSDRVNLSNLAESINQLDGTSPQREERVQQLAALYQAGKYEPNAEAVGGAMIDEAIGQSGSTQA
jgi:flagellar biosynthesis anti-sigma factor FlgM